MCRFWTENAQGRAHTLFERGALKSLRELSGTTRVLGRASKTAQSDPHVPSLLFGQGLCLRFGQSARPRFGHLPRGKLRRGPLPCLVTLSAHEGGPEHLLGLVLVVRAASKPHPLHGRCSPSRHGLDMVELEEAPCPAPMSLGADEGALAPIPFPDRASNPCRNGTASGGRGSRPHGSARPARNGSELPLFELRDEGIEGSIDHLGHISRGDGMAQQSLGVHELLPRALRDRELE